MKSTGETSNQSTTYIELSQKFRGLYPTVVRAFQLIAQMYNRLTLVDKMPHDAALNKIYNDHKDLHGFSRRNIYRYLPSNNPSIPKRVVSPRHKSSHTESIGSNKLSSTKLSSQPEKIPEDKIHDVEPIRESSEIVHKCVLLTAKNQELEEALLASSRCTRANNLIGNEIVYEIPKEKMYLLTEALDKSNKVCFATFDNNGNFVNAEADADRTKQAVPDNGKK